ncbi:DUF4138 domain-containing protein [Chitinophaga sp. Cy-1792]|uniref:DUF4138 domain-containing protein n=1 Tax=Chitinophaga sp. Cy-1792 TaxID=2608339 RepID=UPI00141DE6EC|nr:DUF4138 domain-containing protein [Chitinophaga sp. Cy-1792]
MAVILSGPLRAQQRLDTIYVTKGAATFLHSPEKIISVQTGNGNGKELQYQVIKDKDLLLISAGMPRNTNLLVVTESASHYFIVVYKENIPLSQLRYELDGKKEKGHNDLLVGALPECEDAVLSGTGDTVIMNRLVNEMLRQRSGKLLARISQKGVQVSVRKVLLLNRYCYFSIEVRNRSHIPVELQPIRMYKSNQGLNTTCMAVIQDMGADVIATGETVRHVVTIDAPVFDKRDRLLFSVRGNGVSPLLLKMAATKLPGYILAAR